MYKVIRFWVFIVIAGLFFVGSLDFAEGKSKGNGDRPQGWDKGEKKGLDRKDNSGEDKPKGKKTKKNNDDKSSDDNSSSVDNSDDKKEKKKKDKKKKK